MNKELRDKYSSRKRTRQEVNLNNTSETQPKHRRFSDKVNSAQMAQSNREFIDLSGTINSKKTPNNNTSGNVAIANQGEPASVDVDPAVRELVTDETMVVQRALEQRMKGMIEDQMSEMRRSIAELSKAVKEMSVTRSQSQPSLDSRRNNTNQITYAEQNNMLSANDNLHNINIAESEVNNRSNEPTLESNRTPENGHRNAEKTNIRVDKWGIIFDGNNTHMSVDDFIFRIEYLQAHYDISWDEILRDFHLLVTGAAKDWYWLLVRTHGGLRWPTLKAELRNQYQTNVSNFEIMRDLVERRQQYNEPLDTFFFEMSKLRSRLMQPIPEYDMIKILKRNVRESIARIVYPIAVSSVEQLRMECREAERNFLKREIRTNFPQQRITRNVNEVLYEDMPEEEQEVEELAAAKVVIQKQNLICWNCKRTGHGFRDCNASERSLFCYKCGKPNVVAPKCPDCQQGNRMKDAERAGDPRPTKTHN